VEDGKVVEREVYKAARNSRMMSAISHPAKAHYPPGTAYNCETTYNGKQSCGCR
jgi:hypothetical protein